MSHLNLILLFKNVFKNVWKSKINLLTLTGLVILSSIIVTCIFSAQERVTQEYQNLQITSNIHDAVADFSNVRITFDGERPTVIDQTVLQQQILHKIATDMGSNSNLAFTADRVESRTFDIQNGTKKIKVLGWNSQQTVDKLVISSGTELTNHTNFDDKNLALEDNGIVLNQEFAQNNSINIGDVIRLEPDIFGVNLLVKKDVVTLKGKHFTSLVDFNAWKNNSFYKNYYWYMVIGYGVSSDFTTPIINKTTVLPNKNNQGIAYIADDQFGLYLKAANNPSTSEPTPPLFWTLYPQDQILISPSAFNNETYFSLKFLSTFLRFADKDNGINAINQKLFNSQGMNINIANKTYHIKIILLNNTSNINNLTLSSDSKSKMVYGLHDSGYRYYERANLLRTVIRSFNIVSAILLIFIVVITTVIILLVVGKEIENSSKQIGILKALSCSNIVLLFPYLVYSLIISLLGGIIGFAIGMIIQTQFIGLFANYFNIDFQSLIFPWLSLILSVLILFVLLSIFVLTYAYIIIRKKPLFLLSNVDWSNTPSSGLGSALSNIGHKITNRFSFKTKIKWSFFSGSQGKLLLIFFTMLLGSFLMSLAVIGPKVLVDLKNGFYAGENYNESFDDYAPVWNNPATFYKTFDYNVSSWQATPDPETTTGQKFIPSLNKLMTSLATGKVNPTYLAPNVNVMSKDLMNNSLSNLQGRLMDKHFFNQYNQYGKSIIASFIPTTMILAWPDYGALVKETVPIKPDNTSGILSPFLNNMTEMPTGENAKQYVRPVAKKQQDIYNLLRNFYLKYRSTIDLSFNNKLFENLAPSLLKTGNGTITTANIKWGTQQLGPTGLKTNAFFVTNDPSKTAIHSLQLNDFHLANNEDTAIVSTTKSSDLKINYDDTIQDLINWVTTCFLNRVSVGIVQGTYSRSPYFTQQAMARVFNDPNHDYYIGFNTIPYDPSQNYLGTAIPVKYQGLQFKLYGLTTDQNLISLKNSTGDNIAPLLYQSTNPSVVPIILNQSVVKKLNLHLNDILSTSILQNDLSGGFKDASKTYNFNNNLNNWDFSDSQISGSDGFGDQSSTYNNVTYKSPNQGSSAKPFGVTLTSPSNMTWAASSGLAQIKKHLVPTQFRLVGISDNYNQGRGYIAQTQANHLLNYDQSAKMLYRLFFNNWQKNNLREIIGSSILSATDSQVLQDIADSGGKLSFLQNAAQSSSTAVLALKIFEHDYPIFNYKLSSNKDLVDINSATITTQRYGDFSMYGLDGGTFYDSTAKTTTNFPILGQTVINTLGGKTITKSLLDQLVALLYIIMILFIVISVLIAGSAVLIATNLVIKENKATICTMKVIGYSDWEITQLITSIYVYLLFFAFGIAFTVGWFTTKYIIQVLAQKTIWVLPLMFTVWLPFLVFSIIASIYVVTFVSSWSHLKKYRPVLVLKEMD